jgi:L-alanine-DL-glutamate epimerase-like enolase superfamily enzyme
MVTTVTGITTCATTAAATAATVAVAVAATVAVAVAATVAAAATLTSTRTDKKPIHNQIAYKMQPQYHSVIFYGKFKTQKSD